MFAYCHGSFNPELRIGALAAREGRPGITANGPATIRDEAGPRPARDDGAGAGRAE